MFGFVSSKAQGVGVLVLRINAWCRPPGVETPGSMDLRV